MQNEEPPCDSCDKVELMSENKTAWQLWCLVNSRDRGVIPLAGVKSLTTDQVENICKIYDQPLEVYEKILLIEEQIYPKIIQRQKEESDRNHLAKGKKGF